MDNKNNNEKMITAKREENAVVLDYLSRGYVTSDMSKFNGKAILIDFFCKECRCFF